MTNSDYLKALKVLLSFIVIIITLFLTVSTNRRRCRRSRPSSLQSLPVSVGTAEQNKNLNGPQMAPGPQVARHACLSQCVDGWLV